MLAPVVHRYLDRSALNRFGKCLSIYIFDPFYLFKYLGVANGWKIEQCNHSAIVSSTVIQRAASVDPIAT